MMNIHVYKPNMRIRIGRPAKEFSRIPHLNPILYIRRKVSKKVTTDMFFL